MCVVMATAACRLASAIEKHSPGNLGTRMTPMQHGTKGRAKEVKKMESAV